MNVLWVHRLAVASALAVGLPSMASGQTSNPADPAAPVTPNPYRSAFEGYRGFGDTKLGNWRALNEEVARVGGHAGAMRAGNADPASGATGHAGHAAPGAPAAPARATSPEAVRSGTAPTPAAAGAPAAGGHAGHGR